MEEVDLVLLVVVEDLHIHLKMAEEDRRIHQKMVVAQNWEAEDHQNLPKMAVAVLPQEGGEDHQNLQIEEEAH